MKIGFCFCGSFCTYSKVFPILEQLSKEHDVIPIFSEASAATDSRFGQAKDFLARAESICDRKALTTLEEVEPIGPKKLLDLLIIAPCTGNTLAKLSHSIADGPVTMAAKSHLRNARPVLLAVSTNDALAALRRTSESSWGGKTITLFPSGRTAGRISPHLWLPTFP